MAFLDPGSELALFDALPPPQSAKVSFFWHLRPTNSRRIPFLLSSFELTSSNFPYFHHGEKGKFLPPVFALLFFSWVLLGMRLTLGVERCDANLEECRHFWRRGKIRRQTLAQNQFRPVSRLQHSSIFAPFHPSKSTQNFFSFSFPKVASWQQEQGCGVASLLLPFPPSPPRFEPGEAT